MAETVFLYGNQETADYYLIVNNSYTKNVVQVEDIYHLGIWNNKILLNQDYRYIFADEDFNTVSRVIFVFSLIVEALLIFALFFGFDFKNQRQYIFERVGGMNRKRIIAPNLILFFFASIVSFILSIPSAYLLLLVLNKVSFSSPYLLKLNYLLFNGILVFYPFLLVLVLVFVFAFHFLFFLAPKEMNHQLNALKRK